MQCVTTGKLGFNSTNQVFYLNQRVGKFTTKEKLNKKYLYYLLSTKVEENLSISKGAAQPNLSTEQIKNIEFLMPPLAEQQRIVAKLDAAFAEIDKAMELDKMKETEIDHLKARLFPTVLNDGAVMWETVKLRDVCEIVLVKD